jgi:diamine N-acetyltransferase
MLENETIKLRALEPEDLDILYEWENDTTIWHFGETVSPYSRFVLKGYIANSSLNIYEYKQLRLMIELKETKQRIGLLDLFHFDYHNRKSCLGILLAQEYRRKGYARAAIEIITSYAFDFLKIHQLYAYIPDNNEASKALFATSGFTLAGTLTDWISITGEYTDVHIVQLINK